MKKFYVIFIVCALFYYTQYDSKSPLDTAKEHIAANQLDKAVIELKNAIQDDSTLPEPRFLLGKLYFDSFQFENATKELERAIKYKHSKAEVFPILAASYKKTKNDLKLTNLNVDNAGLLPEQMIEMKLYQVQAFLRLNRESEAISTINEIKQLNIKSSYYDLALVYETLIAKNTHSAKFQLAKILTNDKFQPDALRLQAIIQVEMQDIKGALASYKTYVETYPNDLTTAFTYVRLLASNEQFVEAEPVLDKILIVNPKNPLLNQLKGLARFNSKDYEKALPYLEKSLLEQPSHLNTRLAAGTSAFKLKNYQKSNQHLSFISQSIPTSHYAMRLLAASQLAIGESLEASKTVDRFDKLRIEDSELLASLGLSLSLQDEKGKALEYLNKYNKLTAGTTQNSSQLALLKISLNDESGISDLEQLLENNSAGVSNGDQDLSKLPVENILATSYLTNQQFDKALTLADKFKGSDKDSTKGHMLAGFIYSKQKKPDLARIEFEKALAIQPQDIRIKLSLIDLLPNKSINEKREIINELEELLEQEASFIPLLSRYYTYNKQLGEEEKAITFTRNAYQEQPNNLSLAVTLSKMYFTEKNYKETITTLLSVNKINNKPNQYWKLLARSYLKENKIIEANNTYQIWLKEFPKNREAIIGNVLVLQAQNKAPEALELVESYIEKQGNDSQVHILHIGLLIKNKKYAFARRAYNTLPKESHDLPMVKGFLGALQFHEKAYRQSLSNLQLAYSDKPSPENAYLIYQSLSQLKQSKKAYAFLIEHTTSNPNDMIMLMKLASLQVTQDSDQAIINYRKAINKDDNNSLAHNNLAYVLSEKGDKIGALEHAKEAVRIQPNNKDYLDTIGRILLDLNKNSEALMYLSKAVDNNDTTINEGIYLNYIEALIVNNEMFLANKLLNDFEFSSDFLTKKQKLEKQIIL